jgi:regulatory protein
VDPERGPRPGEDPENTSVSKLEPGPGDSVRVRLREGSTLCVPVAVVAQMGLAPGREVGPGALGRLRREEEFHLARVRALRLLGRRAHSTLELRTKLLRKGHPRGAVAAVMEELRRKGWLDDVAFARQFAEARVARGDTGPILLLRDLVGRGIDHDRARATVNELFERRDEEALARALLGKRGATLGRARDRRSRAARAARHLERRGFSAAVIGTLVREILESPSPKEDEGPIP